MITKDSLYNFINDPYNDEYAFELANEYFDLGQTSSALSYYLRVTECSKNNLLINHNSSNSLQNHLQCWNIRPCAPCTSWQRLVQFHVCLLSYSVDLAAYISHEPILLLQ